MRQAKERSMPGVSLHTFSSKLRNCTLLEIFDNNAGMSIIRKSLKESEKKFNVLFILLHSLLNDCQLKNRIKISSLLLFALTLIFCSWIPRAEANQQLAQICDFSPSNQSQYLGLNVTIYCCVMNLGDRMVSWYKKVNQETTILFVNDNPFSASDRYRTFRVDNLQQGTSEYRLLLTNVLQEDDAEYICQVQQSPIKKSTHLMVITSPSPPVVTSNATVGDLMEGDYIQLNCSSSKGNPSPLITWHRNDIPLTTSQYSSFGPASTFGTAFSLLVWKLTFSDHLANFTCYVGSSAINDTLSITEQLNVKFAPVLSLGSFDPLVTVEGYSVVLNCSVYANPQVESASVLWLKNGSVIGSGARLVIHKISSADAGTYTCWAKNFIERRVQMELEVQFPPRLTIESSKDSPIFKGLLGAVEESSINVTCLAASNPMINISTIFWTMNGVVVQYGPYLAIDSVQRSQSGTYSCTATNVMTPSGLEPFPVTSSVDITFQVFYRPGTAKISTDSLEVVKGENVTLECSVSDQGNPPANFTWIRVGRSDTAAHGGSKLSLYQVQLFDAGDYSCIPSNRIGFGVPDVKRLEVNERPEWLDNQFLPQVITSINQTGFNLSCSVGGKPLPNITWYRNYVQIEEFGQGLYKIITDQTMLDSQSFNVTSYLSFKGPERYPTDVSLLISDAGSYTCNATNAVFTRGLSQTSELIIEYAPIFNTSLTDMSFVALHGSVSLQYFANAVPRPTFKWYNSSRLIAEDENGRVTVSDWCVDSKLATYGTVLAISNVGYRDYANYTLHAINKYGSAELTVEIKMTTTPEPPSELLVHSVTWESVELSWQPGYSGGMNQRFIVYSKSSLPHEEESAVASDQTFLNVSGLLPNRNYTFSVASLNENGLSSRSESVVILTPDFVISPPLDLTFNPETLSIFFSIPDGDYCLRADFFDGVAWKTSVPCARANYSNVLQLVVSPSDVVFNVSASVCLLHRLDICSHRLIAKLYSDNGSDIPLTTIVAVSCSCAAVVIILAIVLAVLCYRRRRLLSQKNLEKTNVSSLKFGVNELQFNQQRSSTDSLQSTGFDNPVTELEWNDRNFSQSRQRGDVSLNNSRLTQHTLMELQNSFYSPNLKRMENLGRSSNATTNAHDDVNELQHSVRQKKVIHEVIV